MRTRSRLLLGVGAVVLVLAGTLVGWLVASSRQASLSDSIASAILTGLFTLLGAGLGLVIPMIQDWERTRPDLKLQLSYRCLHASPLGLRMASDFYPRTFSGTSMPPMRPSWLRCEPDNPSAYLVLFVDLQAQNRSHVDDAITEITFELPSAVGVVRLPAHLPDGSDFFGDSIPAHALRHLRLRLMLARDNYANTSNWIPDSSVVWRLVAKTISDQMIVEELRPAGHFQAYEEGAIKELDDWRS